jgi:hypothetical protein
MKESDNMKVENLPLFKTGTINVSKLVKLIIPETEVQDSLRKHRNGDFGITDIILWEENEEAVIKKEGDVVSSYEYIKDGKIMSYWICTNFEKEKTEIEFIEECIYAFYAIFN